MSTSSGLSADQKRRIEENRKKALALRAKHGQSSSVVGNITQSHAKPKTFSSFGQTHHQNFNSNVGLNSGSASTSRGNYGNFGRHTPTSGSSKPLTTLHSRPVTPNTSVTSQANFYSKPNPAATSVKPPPSATSIPTKSFPGPSHVKTSSKPSLSSVGLGSPTAKSGGLALAQTVKGKCLLVSRYRFVVDVGYHAALIAVFKDMPTKQYDPQNRKWSFDLKDHASLVQKMRPLEGVHVDALPRTVQLAFSKHLKGQAGERNVPEADLSNIDPSLVRTLMPFQRDGVNFGIWREGRVLIADDMGLGKTLQAIAVASHYRADWPMLIVVPSSVRFAWRDQLLKWVGDLDPQEVNVTLTSKDSCVSGLVNIVSYDMMVRRVKELAQKDFKVIIMDESHALKNMKAARTQAAIVLLKKCERVILLSGTPALSRPSELFTQISAVAPTLFPKFHEYGLRYCDGRQVHWGWDFTGSSNMTELQLVLEERIMIRRLKKDVLNQLPAKSRQMVILDPGSVKVNKTMKTSHKLVDKMKGQERRGALLEYFHDTASAKIPAVKEYVLDLLDSGKKFLVFAHHQEVLDALEEAIEKKCQYIRIDGKTTPEQRNYFCNKFQRQEDVKLALLSIMAANSGLNMTAASSVVFAELFWNPGILLQAEDRAHRIGQEDSINVQYLVASGTADDYIWPLVQKKLDVLGKAGLTNREDFSDADTKRLQDPKQQDLLAYFEASFFEDDIPETTVAQEMGTGSTTTCTSSNHTATTSKHTAKASQSSMLQYLKPDQSEPSGHPAAANQNAGFSGDMADCDWLDDVDELWGEEDPEAPWPKKPRLH